MLKKTEKKLQELQQKRYKIINKNVSEVLSELEKERNNVKIKELKKKMAKLNKLDDSEKNIHVIWIGIPSKGEFNNLKLWTKYNPKYRIHFWTDLTHILANRLDSTISYNSYIKVDDTLQNNYKKEAMIKDDFYNNWHLKNPDKTFDENVKNFFLNKSLSSDEIDNAIASAKQEYKQVLEDIKKYTTNQVIFHDVNQEKDSIFPSKKYYEGYLETLEHLHLCAGASDRLRYAILDKFGGVYLDTDVEPKFKLNKIIENKRIVSLINLVESSEFSKNQKQRFIINQMVILEKLNLLNDEYLEDFTKKWESVLGGSVDKNLSIFKNISKIIKNMNLNLTPEMELSKYPIDNSFGISFHALNEGNLGNGFIVTKKDSNFLQDLMKGIEKTDEKLNQINVDTYTKLINKNQMILYHTGPANILCALKEKDKNFFYDLIKNSSKVINLDNINHFNSTWYSKNPHKDSITDPKKLKSFFYSSSNEDINYYELKNEYENYFKNLNLRKKMNQQLVNSLENQNQKKEIETINEIEEIDELEENDEIITRL